MSRCSIINFRCLCTFKHNMRHTLKSVCKLKSHCTYTRHNENTFKEHKNIISMHQSINRNEWNTKKKTSTLELLTYMHK